MNSYDYFLLADDFDQHPLFSFAVELAAENLFPRPEVKLTQGNMTSYVKHRDTE